MDLEQDSQGILNLPEDVLRDIFGSFSDDGLYKDDGEIDCYHTPFSAESADLKAVQNTRLVCRRFCEIASPLLAPVLAARINSESLTRIDRLTRNPLIAAGVRFVRLSLEYRPQEIAFKYSRYRNRQLQKIRRLLSSCDWMTEFADPDNMSEEEQKADDASHVYYKISDALLEDSDTPADENVLEFWELAHRCFEEYRREHDDQYRLLTDGSFAGTVAASIGRLPSLRALSVVDRSEIRVDYESLSAVPIVAHDMEKLHRLLVEPEDWRTIEEMSPTPVLLPAKLLWELPIAIHESGNRLRELSISALPLHTNFDMLCPRGQDGWDRLQAAFRCLRRVEVGASGGNMNCRGIRKDHLPPEQKVHIDNYLAALLSGPCVELASIDLNSLKLNTGRPRSLISPQDKVYRIGQVLAPVSCPRLRTLYLSSVALSQEELEGFIRGLVPGLRKVHLYSVAVLGGGWARPLDLLRENLLRRRSPGECSVSLGFLYGGGFDLVEGYNSDSDGDMFDALDKLEKYWNGSSGNGLHRQAERYVSGVEGMVNPLAELEAELRH